MILYFVKQYTLSPACSEQDLVKKQMFVKMVLSAMTYCHCKKSFSKVAERYDLNFSTDMTTIVDKRCTFWDPNREAVFSLQNEQRCSFDEWTFRSDLKPKVTEFELQ